VHGRISWQRKGLLGWRMRVLSLPYGEESGSCWSGCKPGKDENGSWASRKQSNFHVQE